MSRGHERIALALPDGHQPLGPVRLRFAAEAGEILGHSRPVPLAVPTDRAGAAHAVTTFLARNALETAIAAFDDQVARQILLGTPHDLGLGTPADLAVIGFDDTAYGALSAPALTTVRIDAERHGRKAARVIPGLDRDGFTSAAAKVIVRESA